MWSSISTMPRPIVHTRLGPNCGNGVAGREFLMTPPLECCRRKLAERPLLLSRLPLDGSIVSQPARRPCRIISTSTLAM
jgi:hypothetical protein